MSQIQQSRRRVNYNQLQNLYELLNERRDIAVGYNKSAQARQNAKLFWERAAAQLNSLGDGAIKSSTEWSKYWVDMKSKLKKKNREIGNSSRRTGGGPPITEELSEIELKFISILGNDIGFGLPLVQVDPFHNVEPVAGSSDEALWLEIPTSDDITPAQSGSLSLPRTAATPSMAHSSQSPIITSPQMTLPSPPVMTSLQTTPPSLLPASSSLLATPPEQARVSSNPLSHEPFPPMSAGSTNPTPHGAQRRRRRQNTMTAADARAELVASAQQRAASEAANTRILQEGLLLLRELISILRSNSGGEPRGVERDSAV